MYKRHVYTIVYRNYTNSPKHRIIEYTLVLYPINYRNYEDKHIGQSTRRGGICPKC